MYKNNTGLPAGKPVSDIVVKNGAGYTAGGNCAVWNFLLLTKIKAAKPDSPRPSSTPVGISGTGNNGVLEGDPRYERPSVMTLPEPLLLIFKAR